MKGREGDGLDSALWPWTQWRGPPPALLYLFDLIAQCTRGRRRRFYRARHKRRRTRLLLVWPAGGGLRAWFPFR